MSSVDTAPRADAWSPRLGLTEAFIAAVVLGAGLAFAARHSALTLLIAVAVAQALLALVWVFGTAMPGRWGGLVIATLASAGADVAVSVRPHERLGVLLTVLGLVIPAIFIHQLARGAARVQVVTSMGAVALLAVAEVALAALPQTRHEFTPADAGGKVVAAVVASIAVALAVGFVVDTLLPVPRFDQDVARGLLALVVSAAAGAGVGYLMLHSQQRFGDARGAFVGAALGVLAALVSVACSFVLYTTPVPGARWAARLRVAVTALLPIAVLAPPAFLLCLAVRT